VGKRRPKALVNPTLRNHCGLVVSASTSASLMVPPSVSTCISDASRAHFWLAYLTPFRASVYPVASLFRLVHIFPQPFALYSYISWKFLCNLSTLLWARRRLRAMPPHRRLACRGLRRIPRPLAAAVYAIKAFAQFSITTFLNRREQKIGRQI
jgi:hypothetical protein